MSRPNRRKPGAWTDQRTSARFTLTRTARPLEAAAPSSDAFSELELEFFRKGEELETPRPPEPPLDLDNEAFLPAAE